MEFPKKPHQLEFRKTIATALLVSFIFSVVVFFLGQNVPSLILTDNNRVDNIWFEADTSRVFKVMTDRFDPLQSRSSTHPLFALFSFPFVQILKKILNLELVQAVKLTVSVVAFVWMFLLFSLFRLMGLRRLDACIYCALASVSSASVFYFAVPETFSYGSVTILMALVMALLTQSRFFPTSAYVLMNLATMSMTITNWMAGGLVTFLNKGLRQTIKIIIYTFFVASLLWSIQKIFFPDAKFFFDFNREANFMLLDGSGGPLYVINSFFFHTMVMPAIYLIDKFTKPDWPLLLTQLSMPGSATSIGKPAVVLWAMLMLMGTAAIFVVRKHQGFRLALGLLIIGQLAMHIVYGDETFLYSLHFVVLLVPLVALNSLTRWRAASLVLTLLLIPCVAINNAQQFQFAMDFFKYHGTAHQEIRANMHFRPHDPWPRSKGHVVLAYPGTDTNDKAYHEPGGSFSPSVESFGVSIWVSDPSGKITTTSDTIALKDIAQRFIATDQPVPSLETRTPYYEATWSALRPGQWKMDLKKIRENVDLHIVVRSVGPAAGNVNRLDWQNSQLKVNGRWGLAVAPLKGLPVLGDETMTNWKTMTSSPAGWTTYRGWGFARFNLEGTQWSLVIDDPKTPQILSDLNVKPFQPIVMSLPDEHFVASYQAQLAHLTMGLVGLQTRPGDPLGQPLPWQREASLITVALLRSGHLDLARQLSVHLAKNDFFGGRGVEADGPGMTLWAVGEVNNYLRDQEYSQMIWPHVVRKADWIERMLTTDQRMSGTNVGRPVPSHKNEKYWWVTLAAEPAKDGLIIGKVEQEFLTFYINAVSWSGLISATQIADRRDDQKSKFRWTKLAKDLQKSWQTAYGASDEETTNAYTYASALWPTGIVRQQSEIYKRNLQKRWNKNRDDKGGFRYGFKRPAFAVSDAHQWLLLGNLDLVWKSLRWLWANQSSPGLYTYSEILDDQENYKDWETIRGWLNLHEITPHYGTAAELVLLQLNILAYMDEQAPVPTVVIGAGVPKEWLPHPMSVQGLSFPERTVSWHWDGKRMMVDVKGAPVDVRLGPSFSSQTEVIVNNK